MVVVIPLFLLYDYMIMRSLLALLVLLGEVAILVSTLVSRSIFTMFITMGTVIRAAITAPFLLAPVEKSPFALWKMEDRGWIRKKQERSYGLSNVKA